MPNGSCHRKQSVRICLEVPSDGRACELTFCLKELRAASMFCDFVNKPLVAHFETPGKPIIFSVNGEGFESDYVLATLEQTDEDGWVSLLCLRRPTKLCVRACRSLCGNAVVVLLCLLSHRHVAENGQTPGRCVAALFDCCMLLLK